MEYSGPSSQGNETVQRNEFLGVDSPYNQIRKNPWHLQESESLLSTKTPKAMVIKSPLSLFLLCSEVLIDEPAGMSERLFSVVLKIDGGLAMLETVHHNGEMKRK